MSKTFIQAGGGVRTQSLKGPSDVLHKRGRNCDMAVDFGKEKGRKGIKAKRMRRRSPDKRTEDEIT